MRKIILGLISLTTAVALCLSFAACTSKNGGTDETGETPESSVKPDSSPATDDSETEAPETSGPAQETEDPSSAKTYFVDAGVGNEDGTHWAPERGLACINGDGNWGDDVRKEGFRTGDNVTVEAAVLPGYRFVGWVELWNYEGGFLSNEARYTFTIADSDVHIMAVFEAEPSDSETEAPETSGSAQETDDPSSAETYFVDAGVGNEDGTHWAPERGLACINGDGNWGDDVRMEGFRTGDNVTVEASVLPGYRFVGWVELWNYEGGFLSSEAKYTFTIADSNVHIMAIFEAENNGPSFVEAGATWDLSAGYDTPFFNIKIKLGDKAINPASDYIKIEMTSETPDAFSIPAIEGSNWDEPHGTYNFYVYANKDLTEGTYKATITLYYSESGTGTDWTAVDTAELTAVVSK